MTRKLFTIILSLLLAVNLFAGTELKEKLAQLPDVSNIEEMQSTFAEKYLFKVTQPLDQRNPEKGTFTQSVVVCHAGFDRPTIIVTEGYGGEYARSQHYNDELSKILNANIVHVEHRYFSTSTPSPLDWSYLTAENSAYDLHHVRTLFKDIYPGKWVSTGISKGGTTTMIYRAFFPDDVDISVPYVGPLCRGAEDGRHEQFLRKVGTKDQRKQIENFQLELLKRKDKMMPLLQEFCKERNLTFSIPLPEVFDYCVLEYSFAFWQWGTPFTSIPSAEDDDATLFKHIAKTVGPEYFADHQPIASFFVQAAHELGYYGYDARPFRKYMKINTKGYMSRIMLPPSARPTTFDPSLYKKIYTFLKENDPKMIFIYGEIDPWSAVRVPIFKNKINEQVYIQPGGSHRTRIGTMPEEMKQKIVSQLKEWIEAK